MKFSKIIEITYALFGKQIFHTREQQRCRHFSFILDKNKILSIGINSAKTHPKNLRYNYIGRDKKRINEIIGTHSEMNAVLKYGKICKGLTIVNTRINRKNELVYSRPCNGCLDMLTKLGFGKIFYIDKNKKMTKL